jgi:hypothetical protein
VHAGLALAGAAPRARRRQHAVEAAAEAVERDVALGDEARHLAERVDAGVGARGARHRHRAAEHPGQRLLDVLLRGRAVRLPLPAAQRRPVVLDRELDRPRHASRSIRRR